MNELRFCREKEKRPIFRPLSWFLRVIWIWLEQQADKIYNHTESEKPSCKNIDYTQKNFTFIEFVGTYHTEEEAKQKSNPLEFAIKYPSH